MLLRYCGEAEAESFAERLVTEAAKAPVRISSGASVSFTLSAGYARGRIVPAGRVAVDAVRDILERADSALYEAKRCGRNRALGTASNSLLDATSVPTLLTKVMAV